MDRRVHRELWGKILFCAAVFLAMLLFFTALHPIPIMDEDDVIYSVLVRKTIPVPGGWNPARMMPEVLMGLCGHLAAMCTVLGMGRFIDCQVFLLGLMLSSFITAYVIAVRTLLERRFQAGRFVSGCLSLLFLLLHFLIFRVALSRNLHLFHTYDACCVCYYTIPALLNCTLVMRFMAQGDAPKIPAGDRPVLDSLRILTLYFAIFSNLFGSIILAAYAGWQIVRDAVLARKAKESWKQFIRKDAMWLLIVMLWLLAVLLEGTGGRAAAAEGEKAAFSMRFGKAFAVMADLLLSSSVLFKLLLVAATAGAVGAVFIRPDREGNDRFLRGVMDTVICGLVTGLFLLLLCAAVEPVYSGRTEVILPFAFTLLMLMILCVNFIVQKIPQSAILLPLLLLFLCSMTNTRYLTFADSNPLLLDGHLAVAVENDIYENIIAAAKAGESEVTVRVPKSNEPANWPHDGLIGDPIAQLFWKYGIIDHEIKVWTEPSEEFNEEFHIHLD